MIRIEKRGIVHILPESFAIDSGAGQIANETLSISGAHGELPLGIQCLRAGNLTLSGILKGLTEQDAQSKVDAVKSALIGGELKLFRNNNDTRFIRCVCEKVDHNYHRGSFSGSVASISATLKSIDGFWVEPATIMTEPVAGIPLAVGLDYSGSIATPVVIRLTFSSGITLQAGVIISGIVRLETVQELQVLSGQVLVVDTEQRIVSCGGANILNIVEPEFLLELGHVHPGEQNQLTIVPSGISGELKVEYTPRFA